MGVTGRKRKHDSKMARKRAAKAERRAKYKALAGTSKRAKRQNRHITGIAGTFKHAHKVLDCGNPGCKKCYPKLNPVSCNVLARQMQTAKVA